MARPVKQARRYDSPRRREQAAATRENILDAAQRLFERDGYSATTMGAIAAEAGVAVKTVYLAFETKSGLLRALWHLLLRGDQDDVPIGERPWFKQVAAEPDPVKKIRLAAHNSRLVKERAATLMEILRGASSADPDIAELWDRIQTDFHDNQGSIVAGMHANGALREGLDAATATDILWTLNHPNVWQLLVVERGWSAERYEEWLADTVCRELLAAPPA